MKGKVKPALLIFYDHFFPAYKAGGPIQSITNLANALQDDYSIYMITSSYDLNEVKPLANIKTSVWSQVCLPASTTIINVWYAVAGKPSAYDIKAAIIKIDPAAVYLNGMFSYRFVLVPLMVIKRNMHIVICPRGMLQEGALATKSLKKKIYLTFLKMSGLCRRVSWHATNEEEGQDIKRIFGKDVRIIVAGNIPKMPVDVIKVNGKQQGQLRLVYLSLITEKKNLLQLINIISKLQANVTLDIYGPVKDKEYFKKCQHAISLHPSKIIYKGDVKPIDVQETFGKYDASILLTKGENFGHALYESLSVGCPVITSNFTAWNGLQENKAGWNVDISNEKEIVETIIHASNMDTPTFSIYQSGSFSLAWNYYRNGFDIGSYTKLFRD